MIKALATFVLIGTIDSMDTQFATVEINHNPATAEPAAMAVLPLAAFPCEVREGDTFYVVKLDPNKDAFILCAEREDEPPLCHCTHENPCD
jgi:hypothetical protein